VLAGCVPLQRLPRPGVGGGNPSPGRLPPVELGEEQVLLFWGPSNAGILGNHGGEYGDPVYYELTGRHLRTHPIATWGGVMLGPLPGRARCGSGGDFAPPPHSTNECYQAAVNRTREALDRQTRNRRVSGIVWHSGGDQNRICSPFYTESDCVTFDEYAVVFRDLIRAVARDLPGVRFYVIAAGTSYEKEVAGAASYTAQFRELEKEVCEAEPNCAVLADATTSVVAAAQAACGADLDTATRACIDADWFESLDVHWRPAARELIMQEAARNLAAYEGR
jgi:hypothetical protein